MCTIGLVHRTAKNTYGQLQSEKFLLQNGSFNPSDHYAVAMLHNRVVVGHVLQVISAVCLRRNISQGKNLQMLLNSRDS